MIQICHTTIRFLAVIISFLFSYGLHIGFLAHQIVRFILISVMYDNL